MTISRNKSHFVEEIKHIKILKGYLDTRAQKNLKTFKVFFVR